MAKYQVLAYKRQYFVLLFVFLVSGCAKTTITEMPTLTKTNFVLPSTWTATSTAAATNALAPTLTATTTPRSITPKTPVNTAVPTQTLTPGLSEIPQSTFISELAVTNTPSPKAMCPPDTENPTGLQDLVEFLFPEEQDDERTPEQQQEELTQRFLGVLDSGGILSLYSAILENPAPPYYDARLVDLTNDGVSELIFTDQNYYYPARGGNVYVFGCSNGAYQILLVETPIYDEGPGIVLIQDLNMNGIVDLVIGQVPCHYCYGIRVYEWDGDQFQSLVRKWFVEYYKDEKIISYGDMLDLGGYGSGSVQDIDSNGTYELIVEIGMPSYPAAIVGADGPWREERLIYMWNGLYFGYHAYEYTTPPVFRFQAVQDGDMAFERGKFETAISAYQDAIFSDELSSWNYDAWHELVNDPDHTSMSMPDSSKMPFNEIEYEQLAAYARFRIMLLHILRGWSGDAETVYATLQQKVTIDSPGYPYLEIATLFWDEYKASGDIGSACAQAIAYAEEDPELLDPLGTYQQGFWSRNYRPVNICPFTNNDKIE